MIKDSRLLAAPWTRAATTATTANCRRRVQFLLRCRTASRRGVIQKRSVHFRRAIHVFRGMATWEASRLN